MTGTATQVEGLRERKKRATRQRISDVATELFLRDGFDAVPISAVALASEVSEKTVYNYFPTKEALVLDQEPVLVDTIGDVFGARSGHASPVEAMTTLITAQLTQLLSRSAPIDDDLAPVLRFLDMVDGSASLLAAQRRLDDRLTQQIAAALAERGGFDPGDPEPQAGAHALTGLWLVANRTLRARARAGDTPRRAKARVHEAVARAAAILGAGLASWPTRSTAR